MDPVERIELFHVRVPLPAAFYPSWIPGFPQTENRFTLLKMTTRDGVVGVSAGPAFEDERAGLGSLLGPYLLGVDAGDIEGVTSLLRQASFLGWRNPFVEGAFWDAKAKAAGVPAYRLINPSAAPLDEVRVYCSTGEVRRPEQRLPSLDDVCARGFHGIKLRVHSFDEESDFAIVRAVRKHVGEGFPIMVDANQGWLVSILGPAPVWDRARALRFTKVAEENGVAWLEEPLDQHAYEELALLRAESKVQIAGAELNAGWHEFKVMLERDCFDIYQPDCTLAGGISECARLARAAHERGRRFTPHTWTNGIGFLMNLHLKAAFPSDLPLEYPFEPPGWVPSARDGVLVSPIEVSSRGTVRVPGEPGLGIHLDERALRRFGKRFYVGTKLRVALRTVRNKGLKTALELKRKKDAALERQREKASG